MKKFYSSPVAPGVPFDNEDNNFQSDNVQDAIEEAKVSGIPFNEIDCGIFLTDRHYKAYSATPGQLINTSKSTIVLNDYTSTSDTLAFNLSSGEVRFWTSGRFYVDYSVTFENSTGTRTTTRSVLELNTGSGFQEIPGSEVYTYERNTANDRSTGSNTALIEVNVGDIIRISSARTTGSNNLTLGEGCSLLIKPQKELTEESAFLVINGADVTDPELLFNYNAGEL